MVTFTRKDNWFFIASLILLLTGFLCMAFDTADNGFGIATLWIAPPLLLIGFALPIVGIIGYDSLPGLISFSSLKANRWKHLLGALTFIISLSVYLITAEPTASLWDCSEFIACAFKLQVPHTPGNPLLLLIGRLFAMLAFNDVTHVARNINAMSGLFSALTVCLVYYLICYLGSSLISSSSSHIPLLIASFCGSMCLAFSDTFWFSAVEAETYGPACFFLVLIVALTLKGKSLPEPQRSRYLILIFYIAGLSYCIHPMCILTLPVLPFAWYTYQRKLSIKNILLPVMGGMLIVMLINRFVSIGIFELAFNLDLFLVNSWHLPFYSGAFVLLLFFIVIFRFVLLKYVTWRSYTWSLVFLLFGFTPYLMLFIRSNHNPPIDENNPENLSLIKAYMNRESYPSSPLLYGPYYDAEITKVTVQKKIYFQEDGQYKVAGTMPNYEYDQSRSTFFPRIYSNDADHVAAYKQWTGLKDNERPHFADNLVFMFKYQIGHMYLRYLLWNFAGRESDHQDCNWLRPWDQRHDMNSSVNENRARNQYWMIPLALGLLGLVMHYQRDRKNFYSTLFFFLITGLVLAVYLNSYPVEPRERDYIYVGSYIAFAIWIGLGVLAVSSFVSNHRLSISIATALCIAIPAWMVYENYDDHNRAGRTFQIDNARNQLSSCAPNAILFTGGDNDTFPLWYLQEVEGFRTDVRVMVSSYLNTDWYINQLRKPYYQSAPFNLTLDRNAYRQYGANDVIYLQETIKEPIDLNNYLQLLQKEHKALRMQASSGDVYSIIPSRTVKFRMNKPLSVQQAINHSSSINDTAPSETTLKITGNYMTKGALAILDILASNNEARPMYFNFTSLNNAGLELTSHVVQEGTLYRFIPGENKSGDIRMNTQLAYTNLIEKADYSNLADESLNFNYEDYQSRIIAPLRLSFNSLAIALLNEGDETTATKVMDFALDKIYFTHLRPTNADLQTAEVLMALGKEEQAKSICISLFDFHYDQLQADIKQGNRPDRLDRYLVTQAAQMLDELDDTKYSTLLNGLGL